MEEQISKSAGADAGEYLPVEEIRRLIEEMGRIPVERTTTYGKISASGTLEANGVLAGGVGASRFLRGLTSLIDPRDLTVIVNTGDDESFFGFTCRRTWTRSSTLSPASSRAVAAGASTTIRLPLLEALRRFYDETWFQLGDRDLATHIFRTDSLRRRADARRDNRHDRRGTRRERRRSCR
jgi:hypothetical protein